MDFIDLKQQKLIRKNLKTKVLNLYSRQVSGLEIILFSKSKFVLCCSSGTDALVLGLIALDKPMKSDSSIFVASTAESVCMLGGIPFFRCKIDTYNICESIIIL